MVVRNRAQCMHCGDILESKNTHDWVACMCGATYVDGGAAYLRRGFVPYESPHLGPGYDDLTEFDGEESV